MFEAVLYDSGQGLQDKCLEFSVLEHDLPDKALMINAKSTVFFAPVFVFYTSPS